MIAISCPGFCMTPFSEMLTKILPNFRMWEIIAEGMHSMPDIADDIQKAQDSHDIDFTVHAPFSDLNIASLNPRIRENSLEQITEAIRISSELGIKLVTIHPGHKSPLGAYFGDRFRETNKKSLKVLDKAQEEYGVVLALENMPKMWISLCHNAEQMRELLQGTDLKICFDFGHANISGAIDELMELKDSLANLHVHDNCGDHDYHLVLGEGNIDWAPALKKLQNYKGPYVIESTGLDEGIKSKEILTKWLEGI
jgi:sugar phosphate isomerase/epimerase